MGAKRFQSRLFLRYFWSSLLIFCIPVLILGYVVYQNAVVNLRKEIETSNLSKLLQVKDLTDTNITDLGRIAAQIGYDPKMTPYLVRNDPLARIEAIDELSRYKALSALAEDIFVIFRDHSSIYSEAGRSEFSTFVNTFYRYDEERKAAFLERIHSVRTPRISPVEEVVVQFETIPMLAYLFPMGEPSPHGTVMFWIKESKLTDLIEHTLGDFQGRVMILNGDGTVLAENNRNSDFPAERMAELANRADGDEIRGVSWQGNDYSIASVRSESTGWTFAVLMPTDQFFGRVVERRTFVMLTLSLVLTAGVIAALYMSFALYRPIGRLSRYASEKIGGVGDDRVGNELDLIRSTIERSADRSRDLEQRIETQRPWMREMAIIKLLTGELKDPQALFRQLLSTGREERIVPDKPGAFVMLVALPDPASGGPRPDAEEKERILLALSEFAFPGGIGFGAEMIHDRTIAILALVQGSPGAPVGRAQQQLAAMHVHELLARNGMGMPTIAVGKPAPSPAFANRSFIEASAAMEHRLKHGRGSMIFFEDLDTLQEQFAWYPVEEQVKFVHSLKKGDETVALEALHAMFAGISVEQQSILLLKCMCIDIINTLLKTIHELNLRTFDASLREMVEFTSLPQLEERLRAVTLSICAAVSERKNAETGRLRQEILAYIERRYVSFELTLELAADQFGMSASSLGRLIKELTGMTFTDYVSELRMKEIKRQLIETAKPIKDIIASAGYLDVSTFMRKFKKAEGVTPGEYRKMYAAAAE